MLRGLLAENGIEESRIDVLFSRVDMFNGSVKSQWLTKGFETIGTAKAKYDPYDMQDEFAANNGDFQGYNCRLTAFGLMSPYINVGPKQPEKRGEDFLFLDLDTIEKKTDALCGDTSKKFCAVFAPVKAANSTKVSDQVEVLKKGWKARGVSFDNSKAHMISFILHDRYTATDNTLSVGHVGVLLTAEDGGLYFIEKVAFQEPYRLVKFRNRTELSDYLMKKYDNSWGQNTARPFIMEDDQLMNGYRKYPG